MLNRELLSKLTVFHGASPCVIEALARTGVEIRYPANSVIFLAGSKSRGWFVVLEGQVRVVRGNGDRQHVIHTEGPGGTLGEVPLVTDESYPATAIANEPTRCAVFDRPSLDAAIARCPEIAFVIGRCLAHRVRGLVARLDERSATSVRARLGQFLVLRAEASPSSPFSLGMTQHALAEELGTVREVVARELRQMRRQGLLVTEGRSRYRAPDLDRLRALVRPATA